MTGATAHRAQWRPQRSARAIVLLLPPCATGRQIAGLDVTRIVVNVTDRGRAVAGRNDCTGDLSDEIAQRGVRVHGCSLVIRVRVAIVIVGRDRRTHRRSAARF